MKIIENINSILRFFGYLLPLFILLVGKGFLWKVYNYLNWHHADVFKLAYNVAVVIAILFALAAFIKIYKFGTKRKRKQCSDYLNQESRIRIAKLAEADNEVELYFTENHEWFESDLQQMIDEYTKGNLSQDFDQFKAFIINNAVAYFSHRVTKRNQFLDIINRM